jgi:SecD/SecF fusion protein
LLLVTIALVAAAAAVVWYVPMRRGLDLAGGIRIVLQAEPGTLPKDAVERANKMAAVIRTVEARVKGPVGVAEPKVQRQGDDRVVVELPGRTNLKKAIEEIQSTAQLQFYWLRDVQSERNSSAKWEMLTPEEDERTGNEIYTFRNTVTQEIIRGDTPETQKQILLKVVNAYDKVKNPKGMPPLMTGDDLKPVSKGDLDGNNAIITFQLKPRGAQIFRDFTRRHVGDIVAIFLGDRILTAPKIKTAITGGRGQIEGFMSLPEAQRRAEFLNAGALPVPLRIAASDEVEATLGKETVNQALFAGVLGLGLVLLFMLLYYRLPGVLADVALGIYALLTFAVYKAVGVTMTLPGLAGFILSIGMAVDANILIFERLKEELRSGKTLRAGIDAGFARAFTAIFDSNMCTLITCAVLGKLATGMVQSFAFTLAIGVAISMFTAITVTRTFLHLLVNQRWAQNPNLFGLGTSWFARTGRQLNVVGKRNWYFALSALVIIPGLIFWSTSGLKPGIEFKPGTSLQMTFPRPVTVTEVSGIVSSLGVENTAQISKGTTAFIRTPLVPGNTPKESADYTTRIDGIKAALTKQIGPISKVQTSTVGPTVSEELARNAILAVAIASLAIILYLSFRFAIGGFANGIKFGVCAIAATSHDVLLMTGLFAAMGYFLKWEIDTLFVTALLTMIGFSTHDTIVVFDRIRENLKHRLKGEDYEALTNRSILQTFARSINTSFTVILTLAALAAFGGPIIRHFYVALLVGVVSGTYSSIFNATPLVVVWEGIAARRKAGVRRRAFEDKPLVSKDRARELRPIMESTGTAPVENIQGKEEAPAAARPERAKVKPKKKKRRY